MRPPAKRGRIEPSHHWGRARSVERRVGPVDGRPPALHAAVQFGCALADSAAAGENIGRHVGRVGGGCSPVLRLLERPDRTDRH